MRLLRRQIEKDGAGVVTLCAQEAEDMWHAYNLIQPHDFVKTTTVRKVVNETATGSTTSKRVRLNLTIEVERTEFDSGTCVLRISGRCREENPYVKIGAYHTLALELSQNFDITKPVWDLMHLDRLETASDPVKSADVAAVVMTAGLAHVCLVSAHMTVTRARIDINVPRKRPGASDHAKGLTRFYEAVYRAVLQHVDFGRVRCVLLGGPGFVKDDFWAYLCAESMRRDDRPFIENKGKFVLVHASSGHRAAVDEALAEPAVQARLADTRAAVEARALEAFFRMLRTDPDRAIYGPAHVQRAIDTCAVDTLLVTDGLFRAADVPTRRRYVDLVAAAKANGAAVHVFSSMLGTGEQLGRMTGVAAVLRFPLPDVAEEEALDSDDGDDGDDGGSGSRGGGGDGGGNGGGRNGGDGGGRNGGGGGSGGARTAARGGPAGPAMGGRDMDEEDEATLARGVSTIDMGL